METELKVNTTAYYQSTKRNNNNPFEVFILNIKGKSATVRSQGELKITFNCRLSSLYYISHKLN